MSKRTRALRRLNQQAADALFSEYRETLTRIDKHILSAPISAYQQESIRHDVIEMLADGQARKRRPAEIIGPDCEVFCDSVLAEVPRPTAGEQITAVLADLCSILTLTLLPILSRVMMIGLETQEGAWPLVNIPVSTAIAAGLMGYVMLCFFVLLFRRPYINSMWTNRKAYFLILPLWQSDTLLHIFLFDFRDFLLAPVFQVHAAPVAAAFLLLFALTLFLHEKTT